MRNEKKFRVADYGVSNLHSALHTPHSTLGSRGVSIIAAIFIIVILAFMGLIFVSLISTGSYTSVNDMQATQALYAAEGGMEFILASRTFPNYSTVGPPITLGNGSFTVTAPTYLTADPGAAGVAINVQSTANFPASGRIVIDSELIDYAATNATQFTGATRGAGGTIAAAHGAGNSVFPVARLTDNPLLTGSVTINVNSTTGFLVPGIIRIDNESIYCLNTNGTTQFTNCTRGYKGSTADSHQNNRNVFQYTITSTGNVGAATRVVQKTAAGVGPSTYQGSFAKRSGVGTQAISGIGFSPKAVIFFWTRQIAQGFDAAATSINAGIGFTTGPANERAVSIAALTGGRSDEGRRYSQNNAIIFLSGGGPPALVAQAALNSLDADGFTLNWTTSDANGYIVHYIAFGGDITNAVANTFNLNTFTGNQAITGVGFQPDFVLFLWSTTGAFDSNLTRGEIGIGFSRSAAAQGALVTAGSDNVGNNRDKRWQQRTDSCILLLTTGNPPAQDAIASFVSQDPDGFTINISNRPAASTPIFYLALKGGTHDVGAFNQPVAAGSQTVIGVGFQPEQVMLASFNLPANTGVRGSNTYSGAISVGAAQLSTSRRGIWFQDRSDQDPSVMNMYTASTNALRLATAQTTIDGTADFTAFVSDGFTLNWTATDGTARQILYWAVGPNIARAGSNVAPISLDWREAFP